MLIDEVYLGPLGAVTGRGPQYFQNSILLHLQIITRNHLAVYNYIGTLK